MVNYRPILVAMPRRILFVSTPVSPIGAGDGGGVETTLLHLAPCLATRGHTVAVVAPAISAIPEGSRVFQVDGVPAPDVTGAARDAFPSTSGYGVLEGMWDCARQVQDDFDVIIGMTYDWLSYFLTPYFRTPVLHWITISSAVDAIDRVIFERFKDRTGLLGFYTQTQADTFRDLCIPKANLLPGAVDTCRFPFSPEPENRLCWAGRISREKGLEDAVEVASRAGLPLDICGKLQDPLYRDEIVSRYPDASLSWHGMLPHAELAKVIGNAAAMLVTPKWTEAFGLTTIEALACGTPALAYARGGPAEIVEHGKSGLLIEPDDTDALLDAISRVPELNRANARARAEQFTIANLASHFERWIESNPASHHGHAGHQSR
jgi:UDP-glucose:tetrahydrobiopterin glucosyltransferase